MENVGNMVVESPKSMPKKEFYDMLNMSYINIYIDPEKKRKKIKGAIKMPSETTGWRTKWSKDKCQKYNEKADPKCNSFNVNLEEKNKPQFVVVDCDKEEVVAEILEREGTSYMTRSSGSGLPHLLRRRHPDDNNTTSKNDGYDYLYKNVFELMEGDIENILGDTIEDIPYFMSFEKKETKKKTTKPKKKRSQPVAEAPDRMFDIEKALCNEDREILENIDKRYIDDYNNWLRLLWGIYNHFENVDICDWFSQRGDSYQGYDDVKQHIENDKTQQITWGSVIHFSKESNLENYLDIKARYIVDLKPSEESLSNAFLKLAEGDVLYSDKRVFIYRGEWRHDENKSILKKKIRVMLNSLVKKKINEINDDDEDAPIKNKHYCDILAKVQQRKTIDNVAEFTIQTLAAEEGQKIEFDVNEEQLYNLHFKNGCLELKTKTFRKREKTDYVTQTLDWEYDTNVDKKYIDEVYSFFKKLHSNEEERFFSISWLASCLDGSLHKNMFKLNIGESAENGKSTEFAIHNKCFKIYSDKLQSNFFSADNNKRHKEIIGLIKNPIRFGYMEEMKSSKLDPDILKEMCEGYMRCEILYGTTITAQLQVTLNGCFNKMVNIPLDAGIMRRAVLQSYTSSFPKHYKGEDDYENNVFKPDFFFVKKFEDDNMKNAYLHVLLEHYKVDIDVPERYANNFADMAKEFDEFDNALDNLIERGDPAVHRIGKDAFVECMWNAGCGTKDWRAILSNMKSRKYIYDRQLRCEGRKGCFVGIRFKC